MKDAPGLDIGGAGALNITRPDGSTATLPDAGAVHWSKPTGTKGQGGPLVYLPPDEDITAANAAGKVVIRDFPGGSLPYGAFGFVGDLHHARPGERDRRLRAAVHQHAAGRAARRRSGGGRGSDLQLRRTTQAGARLLRPSQRNPVQPAGGLRRQRRGASSSRRSPRRAGPLRWRSRQGSIARRRET